jgi:hypothetical protein
MRADLPKRLCHSTSFVFRVLLTRLVSVSSCGAMSHKATPPSDAQRSRKKSMPDINKSGERNIVKREWSNTSNLMYTYILNKKGRKTNKPDKSTAITFYAICPFKIKLVSSQQSEGAPNIIQNSNITSKPWIAHAPRMSQRQPYKHKNTFKVS